MDGTAGDDVITVQMSATGDQIEVTRNGQTLDFAASAVKQIAVNAVAGNDTVNIAKGVERSTTLLGGDGDDTTSSARRSATPSTAVPATTRSTAKAAATYSLAERETTPPSTATAITASR